MSTEREDASDNTATGSGGADGSELTLALIDDGELRMKRAT